MRKFTLIGIVLLLLGVCTAQTVFAQVPVVKGTVYLLPGNIPMEGLTVQLLKVNNLYPLRGQDVTDENGFYQMSPNSGYPGNFYVHLILPEGYTVQENDFTIRLELCCVYVFNFYVEEETPPPPLGEIQGTVFVLPAPNIMEGVTVNLLDELQVLLQTTTSDQDGFYSFPGLPAGTYYVQIIVPPNYAVVQNNVLETLVAGEVAIIDFTLYTPSYAGYAGSTWFWQVQFYGLPAAVYSPAELEQFIQDIFDTFYMHPTYPIQVQGVTYEGDPPRALTYSETQTLLNNYPSSNVVTMAKRQYLTVLLDVVSGLLIQTDWVSFDQATASQGIIYVNQIINTTPGLAKKISYSMTVGNTLPAGVIPLSTPFIIYGNGFEAQLTMAEFEFRTPYPNPFNPQSNLQFTLAQSGSVQLTVYDVRGREVEKIVEGFLSSGTHSFIFEAHNLPAGVYFARLIVGNDIQTQKLLLLK